MNQHIINAGPLYDRTVELEAEAAEHIAKMPRFDEMTESERQDFFIWTGILNERSAFKHDLMDAPEVKAGERPGPITAEDIEEIYLLSVEEAEKIPQWILANGTWWWLRSTGYSSDRAANVGSSGFVNASGDDVNNNNFGVRPALKISNLPKHEIGDLVEVFGLAAQYIGNNSVLLCEPIEKHRFDAESNDYEASEVKAFVEEWLRKGGGKRTSWPKPLMRSRRCGTGIANGEK